MQMNAPNRWKALLSSILGSAYQSSLLVALAPNTESLLQCPLLIQKALYRHVCLIQPAGQGCVAGSAQVGVNLDFDKSSYTNRIR